MFTIYFWVCTIMPPNTPIKAQYNWRTSCTVTDYVKISKSTQRDCEDKAADMAVRWEGFTVIAWKCVPRSDA